MLRRSERRNRTKRRKKRDLLRPIPGFGRLLLALFVCQGWFAMGGSDIFGSLQLHVRWGLLAGFVPLAMLGLRGEGPCRTGARILLGAMILFDIELWIDGQYSVELALRATGEGLFCYLLGLPTVESGPDREPTRFETALFWGGILFGLVWVGAATVVGARTSSPPTRDSRTAEQVARTAVLSRPAFRWNGLVLPLAPSWRLEKRSQTTLRLANEAGVRLTLIRLEEVPTTNLAVIDRLNERCRRWRGRKASVTLAGRPARGFTAIAVLRGGGRTATVTCLQLDRFLIETTVPLDRRETGTDLVCRLLYEMKFEH